MWVENRGPRVVSKCQDPSPVDFPRLIGNLENMGALEKRAAVVYARSSSISEIVRSGHKGKTRDHLR